MLLTYGGISELQWRDHSLPWMGATCNGGGLLWYKGAAASATLVPAFRLRSRARPVGRCCDKNNSQQARGRLVNGAMGNLHAEGAALFTFLGKAAPTLEGYKHDA